MIKVLRRFYNRTMYLLKYNCLSKIHKKYREDIERMLSHEIPDFLWFFDSQKYQSKGNWKFLVFISRAKKRPVGFVSLQYSEDKIEATTPLNGGRGIYFEPEYKNRCQKKLLTFLESEIQQGRGHFNEVLMKCTQIEFKFLDYVKKAGNKQILFRLKDDYKSYLDHLPKASSVEILKLWEQLNSKRSIKIGEYQDLDEMLKFKKISFKHYMKFKNSSHLFKYSSRNCHFLTFEYNEKIISITLLICGENKNVFLDVLFPKSRPCIHPYLMIQYGVIKFLELKTYKKLVVLNENYQFEDLKKFGFYDLSIFEHSIRPHQQKELVQTIYN